MYKMLSLHETAVVQNWSFGINEMIERWWLTLHGTQILVSTPLKHLGEEYVQTVATYRLVLHQHPRSVICFHQLTWTASLPDALYFIRRVATHNTKELSQIPSSPDVEISTPRLELFILRYESSETPSVGNIFHFQNFSRFSRTLPPLDVSYVRLA